LEHFSVDHSGRQRQNHLRPSETVPRKLDPLWVCAPIHGS
jgi:hypothetical protein